MQNGTILIEAEPVNRVTNFKYPGSSVQKDRGVEQEIGRRIQQVNMSWRKISGVVCDRKVSDKVKGKLHKPLLDQLCYERGFK